MSSKEFEVNETLKFNDKTWWELRPYMIYMPIHSWAEIKKFIIGICRKTKKCGGKTISNWERTVNVIDDKMANKK